MDRFFLYIILTLTAGLCSCSGPASDVDSGFIATSGIKSLNSTIKEAPSFTTVREREIDSLKTAAASQQGAARWEILLDISSRYRQINADSAIYYAREAELTIPDHLSDHLRIKGKLTYANALSTSGMFSPAIHILDSLESVAISLDSKIELWKSQRIFYSYMLAYVNHQGPNADMFQRKYLECDDSLLMHLPKSDKFYKFIHSERLVKEGRWDEAGRTLQALLDITPKEDNIYGMAAFQLAEVFKQKGDFKKYTEYLALSSESDILAGVREGVALPTLANWLYLHGDIDNAFNFINFALKEANEGNVRMRTITIVPLMPMIDQAYRKKINDSRNLIIGYLIVAVILFIISAGLSGWLIRTMRRNKANEKRLDRSSKILEAYVGNFIGMCSNYAMRLEQLTKLVTRKLAAGQTGELQRLVSSGHFSEGDNEEFYSLIDKAILDIFPDFVESINTLLQPDKQIILKPGESLTPELRIYAFIRLGVDQGGRIAQILQYSVNTVYAYRNRMRNRAVNRENFDNDVKNLGHTDSYLNFLVEN